MLAVYLLVEIVGVHYLTAVIFGLLIAIVGGYALNRRFTYPETRVRWNAGCARSLVVGVVVFCVIVGLTYAFVEYLSMQYLFARSVVAILGGALSFLLDARFTYHVPLLEPHPMPAHPLLNKSHSRPH